MSGRSVTDKWKVCHYGGRLVIVIYFNVDFLIKNNTIQLLVVLISLFLLK